MILHNDNKDESKLFLHKVIDTGIDFKLQENFKQKNMGAADIDKILVDLPRKGMKEEEILDDFKEHILPFSTNFSSTKFMGFPDAGNSVSAIGGAFLCDLMQQNLINQSFCAPAATFAEIAVIRWLRESVGYHNEAITDIWDVGGIITPGGTVSNTIAMMLARENKSPGTLDEGVRDPEDFQVIVPKGIGHYSVKSAQMWVGLGSHLLEVETDDFHYDLEQLEKTLVENKGRVMALVAYAGDSRTMTVDNLLAIEALVRRIDPSIWLHADACHGFSLGFSSELRHKISGIKKFDSISCDPHKVMLTPYTLSTLLVRNPHEMKKITSKSDLIMQEPFAFGQITPFMGSRSWESLKLWFMMKNYGKDGLDKLITDRHNLAVYLSDKLDKDKDFQVLTKIDINAVAFFYTRGISDDVIKINQVNKTIHARLLDEGVYHLHQFSIPDRGLFKQNEIVYPLRFMCGNPNTTKVDVDGMVEYVRTLGEQVAAQLQ